MRTLLMMLALFITVSISGCGRKAISIKPTLQPIDAKTQDNHPCDVTGTVDKQGNITVSKETSECIRTKMEKCEKNGQKLEKSLLAANAQIYLLNSFGRMRYGQ